VRPWLAIFFIGLLTVLSSCAEQNPEPDLVPAHSALPDPIGLSCSGCHHPSNVAIPDISALSSEALYTSLSNYKYVPDGDTVMHRLIVGYSDEELRAISDILGAGHE